MSAIKNRNRQKIQNSEIHAEKAHEVEEVYPACLHLLTGNLSNQNGPPHLGSRHNSLDNFDKSQSGQIDIHPGLGAGIFEGLEQPDPGITDFIILDDADHKPPLDLLAKDIFHAILLRHHHKRNVFLAPAHHQRNGFASTLFHAFQDIIAWLDSGGKCRRPFGNFSYSSSVYRSGHADCDKEEKKQQQSEQQVEYRAGKDNAKPLPDRFMGN